MQKIVYKNYQTLLGKFSDKLIFVGLTQITDKAEENAENGVQILPINY